MPTNGLTAAMSKHHVGRYSLAQIKVTLLQLISVVALLIGFFVVLKPGTTADYQAVITAVFSVIGVFYAKNNTVDSVNKSLTSLLTSVVGVVNLYTTVPGSTIKMLGILVFALIPPILVFTNHNAALPASAPKPTLPAPQASQGQPELTNGDAHSSSLAGTAGANVSG